MTFDPPPGTTLTFEEVVLGRNKPAPIIITAKSLGPGTLRFDPAPSIEGTNAAEFFVSSAPHVLAPSTSGEVYVRFNPDTPANAEAELVIHTNDRSQPEVRYPLRGPARDPCVLSMSPPRQKLEVGDTREITIRSTSTYQCTVVHISTDFTLFELVNAPDTPFTIAAGEEVTFGVKHYVRTLEPGVPIRHVIVHESEGTRRSSPSKASRPRGTAFTPTPTRSTSPTRRWASPSAVAWWSPTAARRACTCSPRT